MNLGIRFKSRPSRTAGERVALSIAVSLVLCVAFAGCAATGINKHATAFSTSLAPVVDQSTAAYQNAVALHNLRGDYEAVVAYQGKDATYNPRNFPALLSEKDIQARLAVLAALQVYSRSLIEITEATGSPDLDAASKSVGTNLTSLGNDLPSSIESVLAVAASQISSGASGAAASSSSAPPLSPEVRNGISAAVNALGQFLISRKVASELPDKIEAMDPAIQLFCKALDDDISALDGIGQRDYDRILDLEKQFILADGQSGQNVNPQAWRAEVMKLPEIARQQQEAHERLTSLREALNKLALTHHALAAEAQHNNPESLKDKLSELASAGSALGKFYSALPAK